METWYIILCFNLTRAVDMVAYVQTDGTINYNVGTAARFADEKEATGKLPTNGDYAYKIEPFQFIAI